MAVQKWDFTKIKTRLIHHVQLELQFAIATHDIFDQVSAGEQGAEEWRKLAE